MAGARLFSAGKTFTLFSGGGTPSSAPPALGPDGTVWEAIQPGTAENPPFVVVGRTASGRRFGPFRGGRIVGSDLPSIAVSRGAAMFAWYYAGRSVSQLRALRCTLRGCGPVGAVASWRHAVHPPLPVDFTGYPAQAAVRASRGTTIVVFSEEPSARMMWAQTAGSGRFGPAHAFGVSGQNEPLLLAEPDGRVLAAWLAGATHPRVDWSEWSAAAGFGAVHQLHGARGAVGTNLVGAISGSSAGLAWIQGDSDAIPGQDIGQVWVARSTSTGGFSSPRIVYGGWAGTVSLAGADGGFALAFSSTGKPGFYADSARGVLIERSLNGGPFSRPVNLDPQSGVIPNATVAVAGNGDVLATWSDNRANQSPTALVAVARRSGAFGRPLQLGLDAAGYGPWAAANSSATVITWSVVNGLTDQATIEGVLARP